jgi:hypothetical protein
VLEFITSISYGSQNNLDNQRTIELNGTNIKRAFDFILEFRENIFCSLQDSKNLVDKVNFPENWMMVYLKIKFLMLFISLKI